MRVGVRLLDLQVGLQPIEVHNGNGCLDLADRPTDLVREQIERPVGPGSPLRRLPVSCVRRCHSSDLHTPVRNG